MGSPRKRAGSGGVRKYGRNKEKCERYRREHRREKSKIRKILRHLKNHPHDRQAAKSIRKLERFLKQGPID